VIANNSNRRRIDWFIKDLHHDGKYYWVYSYISPIVTKREVTGFRATRRPTSAEIEETVAIYAKMLE